MHSNYGLNQFVGHALGFVDEDGAGEAAHGVLFAGEADEARAVGQYERDLIEAVAFAADAEFVGEAGAFARTRRTGVP
jgi:hypothetical protein